MSDPNKAWRILLVEDDPDDALLVREALAEAAAERPGTPAHIVRHVESLEAALGELGQGVFDVVLLDMHLPDASELDLVRQVIQEQRHGPVLVLTGMQDEELAASSLQLGAQDYLVKGRFDAASLAGAIRFGIERHRLRTQLERQARELTENEGRLRRIIGNAADAIVVTDPGGAVLLANPAAEVMFGRGRRELLGCNLGLPTGLEKTELEIDRPDRPGFTVEMRVVDITWSGQMAFLATFRDITAHKETLRELDETRLKQLMIKDQFLSHVSHELRTPLTVIMQHAELLLDGLLGELSPEQQKSLATVKRNCNYLRQMIEDLLEATRADAGKLLVTPLRTDLGGVIGETLAHVRELVDARNLTFATELPAGLPQVLADPSRLRQILTNLLNNAVKFTPAGGAVTVAVARDPRDADHLVCSVTDTGCGIPAADSERIFDPLYQREADPETVRKGLGLGLHICHQLVASQGGRIWMTSEVDVGSTFSFTVPIYSGRTLLAGLPGGADAAGPLCLVAISARTDDRRELPPFERKFLDRVRRVVRSCLMPDRDLLLPRLHCEAHGEVVFVAAGADRAGARILADRILRLLAEDIQLQRSELTFAAHLAELEPARPAAELIEALVRDLAEEAGF